MGISGKRALPAFPPTGPDRATCYRCFRPATMCYCAHCRPVANKTEILILQHGREARHAFNTVRIARLTLARVRTLLAWKGLPAPILEGESMLLYPGPNAIPLEQIPAEQRPARLVVIDGTWSQVRVLARHNPWLAALPQVALNPSQPGGYGFRREPAPHCLSTIEAIVAALSILEPETPDLNHPLDIFNEMVARQLPFTR